MNNPRATGNTLTGILLKQDSLITEDWLGLNDKAINYEEEKYLDGITMHPLLREKTGLFVFDAYATKLYLAKNAKGHLELSIGQPEEGSSAVGAIYLRYAIAEHLTAEDNYINVFEFIISTIRKELAELNSWLAHRTAGKYCN